MAHAPPAHVVVYFGCASCDGRLRAALGMAGRRTTCPVCGDPLRVPAVTTGAPADEPTWTDTPAPGPAE